MRPARPTAIGTVTACLIVGLGGCDSNQREKEAVRRQPDRPAPVKLGLLSPSPGDWFWHEVREGAEGVASGRENVNIVWILPGAPSGIRGQVNALRSLDTSGLGGVLLGPADETALEQPVRALAEAGKPVIVLQDSLKGNWHAARVFLSPDTLGAMAAELLAELVPGGGEVLLLRGATGNRFEEAVEFGFIRTLSAAHSQLRVLDPEVHAGESPASGLEAAELLLIRYPYVRGIFCSSRAGLRGAWKALRDIGRAGEVKLVGRGADDVVAMALGEGEIHGLFLEDPRELGRVGAEILLKAAGGERVPARVGLPPILVLRENMHTQRVQELLYATRDAGLETGAENPLP